MKKIFTLKECLELLPQVRALTAAAVHQAEAVTEQIGTARAGAARRELEERHEAIVRAWATEIMNLGVEVKGMWLVDFDSGDGLYYCWHHPEPTIEYFHDYDSGFPGRRPLGKLGIPS